MHYLPSEAFKKVSDKYVEEHKEGVDILTIISVEEARSCLSYISSRKVFLRILGEKPRYSKVEILPKAIVGTLIIPEKRNPSQVMASLFFYYEANHLIILDDEADLKVTRKYLLEDRFTDNRDLLSYMFEVLSSIIEHDTQYLRDYENLLADLEDRVEASEKFDVSKHISTCRRELLRFSSYYEELLDLFDILIENANGLFSSQTVLHFKQLSGRIDRLYDTVSSLREYAYQVRELQQTQITIRQNETMRLLTVVTTIIMPLTLITGWYGMNFVHMPELKKPYAYFILIGICAVVVILEIRYFKKKGWL